MHHSLAMQAPRRAALVLAVACACVRGGSGGEAVDPTAPIAEVYPEGASDFAGEWVGESAGSFGTLKIERLAVDRYYASFASDDGLTRYVCNIRQVAATPEEGGATAPGNLAVFTWQDGRGGRGQGWVLINRENSALTGEIRVGGAAPLDFVRVDEPESEMPGTIEVDVTVAAE